MFVFNKKYVNEFLRTFLPNKRTDQFIVINLNKARNICN